MTYSIIGRCEGIAANVGVAKTQAFPNRTNDPLAIKLLAQGLLPARVMVKVKVKAVVPPLPSALLAELASMETPGMSSLRMVAVADTVTGVAPTTAPTRVMPNVSSFSAARSLRTVTATAASV